MHIYFAGIGGTGIGPLALIAKQAGYEVSGSDKQDSQYVQYLKKQGINNISTSQNGESIATLHKTKPIDWFVYSSALPKENATHPELIFCERYGIKHTKRDEFLQEIIEKNKLKLVAIAGTHGKTTTTAMTVWLLKQLNIEPSYSVGAKIEFGEMGHFEPESEYFVYECDEFDRNFLTFHPYISLISGIAYDHPDIYPTAEEYNAAFRTFIDQSDSCVIWNDDAARLGLAQNDSYNIIQKGDPAVNNVALIGLVNRQNAWLVVHAVHKLTRHPIAELAKKMGAFPGLSRRFEEVAPKLYSDYAHTPEKIAGALQTAKEVAGQNVVVVYEGLHNTRQHAIKDALLHLFDDVKKLYIVPSYLAREDPSLPLLSPDDLAHLTSRPENTEPAKLDQQLTTIIKNHLDAGDLVLCLTAGGGGSLDEWLREQFKS